MRACKASGASKARRCPSQCKRSKPGLGDLSKLTELFKNKLSSILRFGTLLLTWVSHTQSQVKKLIDACKIVEKLQFSKNFICFKPKFWFNSFWLTSFVIGLDSFLELETAVGFCRPIKASQICLTGGLLQTLLWRTHHNKQEFHCQISV